MEHFQCQQELCLVASLYVRALAASAARPKYSGRRQGTFWSCLVLLTFIDGTLAVIAHQDTHSQSLSTYA